MKSPLRPCAEDIAIVHAAINARLPGFGKARATAVVAGVTPELCHLNSAALEQVVAVDQSPDMIGCIWPGRLRPGDAVICANWRRMPLAASSADIVLADGSLTPLPYPSGCSQFMREVRRILAPKGWCVIRCYTQPAQRERAENVLKQLNEGRIGSIHVLKFRLAMALQASAGEGVAVRAVWQTLNRVWPDLAALAEHLHWPLPEVHTIEPYREADTRYTFPTLEEYRAIFQQGGLRVVETFVPTYELGERCPTMVLEPFA